jgi:hypothetical protein
MPTDLTPGESGYFDAEAEMLAGTFPNNVDMLVTDEVMARTVLINWNAGVAPPFDQELPEQGTVFRMITSSVFPGEVFNFNTQTSPNITSGPEGVAVYTRHTLINKGTRTLKDVYASLWVDPDLGGAGDDFVGCDTALDIFYCYNADNPDFYYGNFQPACGFKLIEGPIVPSAGDTATVEGLPVPGYKNVRMYSFWRFINGLDPDSYQESYCFMNGLNAKQGCIPLIYDGLPTRYMYSGDPVTGTGWLDFAPDDRRMFASIGPFDFRPGDTQLVTIKFAVGQGTDRLSSITSMKEILEHETTPTSLEDARQPQNLPSSYITCWVSE